LTAEQRAELEHLKERFPRLKELVAHRETLRQLFEDPTIEDAPTGAARLQDWIAKARQAGLKGLDAFAELWKTGWTKSPTTLSVAPVTDVPKASTTACGASCGVPSA
jgi:hypothetical protein